jgi:protein phosphatase 1L
MQIYLCPLNFIELLLFQVSNQEAVDIAKPFCLGDKSNTSLQSACKELADLSINRGSLDDVTVMIILLKNFATN